MNETDVVDNKELLLRDRVTSRSIKGKGKKLRGRSTLIFLDAGKKYRFSVLQSGNTYYPSNIEW